MKKPLVLFSTLLLGACQQSPSLPTVKALELDRFMGDWYVIAHIPTWPERKATKAIESYALQPDGSIATTFTFVPEGKTKTKQMTATGFPKAQSNNAVWGMQFIWPIMADYRVAYVDEGYQHTIIGRNKRDYLWIMARGPRVDDKIMTELIDFARKLGYNMDELRIVPQ
ncbi:MAG: lipocalin family protein [Cellvibrionaceae bacterium]|nr:lipocalin family protein [Cellvibrionaceae bacterium]MCV6626015.1 lipocalin family protein [Cellvibrionaceae bacterium]